MSLRESFEVRDDARPAWADLEAALAGADRAVPCAEAPELWFGTKHARALAADLCSLCPVRALCEVYADVGHERDGVWGGVDRAVAAHRRGLAPTPYAPDDTAADDDPDAASGGTHNVGTPAGVPPEGTWTPAHALGLVLPAPGTETRS